VLQGVAGGCRGLQGVAVLREVIRPLAPGVLLCVAVYCRVLPGVAGCCSIA